MAKREETFTDSTGRSGRPCRAGAAPVPSPEVPGEAAQAAVGPG